MSVFTVTGDDTLTLFDRVFNDFADGDNTTISFPNDLMTVKTGKNQNSIFARNTTGSNADLTLRINRGSPDDRFLQGQLSSQERDPAAFALALGEFVKRAGDGAGNVISDIYSLQGGIFARKVDVKENVEGDTEQAIAIYTMKFAIVNRSIS